VQPSIRLGIGFACAAAMACAAGPVDFGTAELNAAVASRNFRYKPKFDWEINLEQPETFRIAPYSAGGGRISGGDLRGLMYGLLEAAEQIRALGHLKPAHGVPAAAPRGVWLAADPAASWLQSEESWRRIFEAMARDRFDRLQLIFDRLPNAALLHMISQMGSQYAVDVVLGLKTLPEDFAPALEALLAKCPAIHTVALEPGDNDLSEIHQQMLGVLAKAGRRVVLETPGGLRRLDSAEAQAGEERIRANALIGPFEIAAPRNERGEPELGGIALWGRLGFDPKPEPAKPAAAKAVPAKAAKAAARPRVAAP